MIVGKLCKIVCCLVILVIVIIVIIAAIIGATFKAPDINIKGFAISNNPPPAVSAENVQFTWIVDATVKNNWRYDLFLSTLGISTQLTAVPGTDLGSGEVQGINLQSGQVTDISIPLRVDLKVNGDTAKVIGPMISCTSTGKLPITYTIKISAKLWGTGPWPVPPIVRTTDAPCPAANFNLGGIPPSVIQGFLGA